MTIERMGYAMKKNNWYCWVGFVPVQPSISNDKFAKNHFSRQNFFGGENVGRIKVKIEAFSSVLHIGPNLVFGKMVNGSIVHNNCHQYKMRK